MCLLDKTFNCAVEGIYWGLTRRAREQQQTARGKRSAVALGVKKHSGAWLEVRFPCDVARETRISATITPALRIHSQAS